MCGIVALWRTGDADLARRMTEKIAHRGPDALHVTAAPSGEAILGHCRLAIIGPEDGRQPIVADDWALVANGEIYNHADLRAMLGPEAFATASDSEAILHAAAGPQRRWINLLDGMFAFVLSERGHLIAGRDPLGIKPLFVAERGRRLRVCLRGQGVRWARLHRRARPAAGLGHGRDRPRAPLVARARRHGRPGG